MDQSSVYNRDRQARTRLLFAMISRPSNKTSILPSYHNKFNDIVFIAYVKVRKVAAFSCHQFSTQNFTVWWHCIFFIFQTRKIIIHEGAPKKKFSHFRCAPSTVHFGDPWYLVFHFLNFKTPHIESHYATSRKVWVLFPMAWREFFNDKIPPSALRPWVRLSL